MSQQEQRRSSLPSSVIQHLLVGPQTPAEISARTRSFTSPGPREGETVELNPPHQLQSSGILPPISSIPEARARAISFNAHRPIESPEPEERDIRDYTAGPSVLHGPATGPSSIPHGQTQRIPIRSDPSFHASRPQSAGYSTTYTLSSDTLPPLRLSSWGDREAGTSSLGGSSYQTRGRPYTPSQVESDRQNFRVGEPRPEERREGRRERVGGRSSSGPQSRNVVDTGGSYVHEFSGAQRVFSADFGNPIRMRNEAGPSLPAFQHLSVGVQAPQPYPFPTARSQIFSLEESIIPNRRKSEADAPTHTSRPTKEEGDGSKISPVQSGKRRRDSVDEDDGKRKKKVPRKIYVACDFCRGRKLRCDGNKPTCWNCISRKRLCEYQPYPRRRGPGKAPKGTRSKRRTEDPVGHLPSIDTFDPQIVIPQGRRQETIDTLPVYTTEETPPPYVPTAESQAGPSIVSEEGSEDDEEEN